jgi:hypothetical protein
MSVQIGSGLVKLRDESKWTSSNTPPSCELQFDRKPTNRYRIDKSVLGLSKYRAK